MTLKSSEQWGISRRITLESSENRVIFEINILVEFKKTNIVF